MKLFNAVITSLNWTSYEFLSTFTCQALRRQKDNKNQSSSEAKSPASFYHLNWNDQELVVTVKAHGEGTELNLGN